LCGELLEETGIDPEYCRDGLLVLEDADPTAALDWGREHGMPIEVLDQAMVGRLAPNLAHGLDRALWLPEIAHVRNPRLIKAIRRAIGRSVRVCEHQEVLELLTKGGRVSGVRTRTDIYHADTVVVCAGAWTATLLEGLGQVPAIEPVRGQMLLFHASPAMLCQVVLADGHYAIPRRDGSILFGSTLEQTGFAKETTSDAKERLRDKAVELLPLLRRTPVGRHWAGLRPGSPSGIPYIGPHPAIGNLFVNAGHFRYGLTMAPASARLVTDLILHRQPIVPAAPYRLDVDRCGPTPEARSASPSDPENQQ
jgi:glycine oxidase